MKLIKKKKIILYLQVIEYVAVMLRGKNLIFYMVLKGDIYKPLKNSTNLWVWPFDDAVHSVAFT